MTKTIETVTGLPSPKDLKRLERLEQRESNNRRNGIKSNDQSRESSASPPLVLRYLETLPPEKEVTLLVEVVEAPCKPTTRQALPPKVEFKAPKIIAELPAPETVSVNTQTQWSTKGRRSSAEVQTVTTVASVVKAEIKEEALDIDDVIETDFESDSADNEEEECFRIIEETVVDVSTLPGRTGFVCF